MRRLITSPAALTALRVTIATAAIGWGLGQLQRLHEAAMTALGEVEAEANAAEARLARLMEAEEEAHERAAAEAPDAQTATVSPESHPHPFAPRRLGQVVPEQRTEGPDFPLVS